MKNISVCRVTADEITFCFRKQSSYYIQDGTIILYFTPLETHTAIRILRDGLFQWYKLTKKSIDEGNPT